jgi:hypothetical protein
MISDRLGLGPKSLVVELASNDGYLLQHFQAAGIPVLGVEPAANIAEVANARGIRTEVQFLGADTGREIAQRYGQADLVAGNNVFAHVPDIRGFAAGLRALVKDEGMVTLEFPHLLRLIERRQYDTIYHEHLRYYSVGSIKHLLEMHGLEVFHARPIPSHGGSIRVYAARKSTRSVQPSVKQMLDAEPHGDAMRQQLKKFRDEVMLSKLRLHTLIRDVKEKGGRIVGISAPSRASTLFNYVGLDEAIIDYVCEIEGSLKIGKCMPGTLIPVVEESRMFVDQPECAIIFSWHIADELAPKLRAKGYKGMLVTPLPVPRAL